jgi:hypothetical protein
VNEFAQILVDGLLEVEAVVGATMTWAGSTVPCVGGQENASRVFDIGGFKLKADIPIVVRLSVLNGNLPKEKQTIIYTSTEGATPIKLRLDSITPFWNAMLILGCTDPSQAA